ncbi:Pentatricopeptide repeat-containing protein [Rhynchospora pubera]|uniref:Pentatricopeptide repeat-containing protein n=1 Tax=Rhynchospora pubera TaxID=906938 RepID=A0AAV8GCR1_9POAL|nr:Pentatricopeptide repeat-containing protein [Rhynchospora pubera]
MRPILSLHLRAICFFANNRSPVWLSPLRSFSYGCGGQGSDKENSTNKSEGSKLFPQNEATDRERDEDVDENDDKLDSEQISVETLLGFPPEGEKTDDFEEFSSTYRNRCEVKSEAQKLFEILQQDGPGYNAQQVLDEMKPKLSNALVREVLFRILISINDANKSRCAKMASKFFAWSADQSNYSHNTSIYNLTMKIFAESESLTAMGWLLEEMLEKGLPVTARTFNILISSCLESGMARKVIERFIMARTFNYRPFKHSFNAILHSLLNLNQYRLIEWVYQQMLQRGHTPDVLTYNIVLRAKYLLGKLDQFHRLLDEMGRNGLAPDLHTYNLLLHVLGKGDKPLAALNLLNYMRDVGCAPSVLHFTNLIDGLSRAGNLEACKYFYGEMMKMGCEPDVVCYTVMITSYVLAGQFEDARELFDQMLVKGHLPNVYTYNTIIKGLCGMGRFQEACDMLKQMGSRGCVPNFSVYCNLVRRLRHAGKVAEATDVVNYMVEKGQYLHLVSRFKFYNR